MAVYLSYYHLLTFSVKLRASQGVKRLVALMINHYIYLFLKGILPRVYESLVVLALLVLILGGLAWLGPAANNLPLLTDYHSWLLYIPLLYSFISLIGVLLLSGERAYKSDKMSTHCDTVLIYFLLLCIAYDADASLQSHIRMNVTTETFI